MRPSYEVECTRVHRAVGASDARVKPVQDGNCHPNIAILCTHTFGSFCTAVCIFDNRGDGVGDGRA
eukprot:COSAG02_NODE_180_length_31057_cov_21.869501_18_plen_66_part_00